MIYGLFLGNDYPGTSYSLPDCVLDAGRMFAALDPYVATASELLRNEECTLANIAKWVRSAAKLAGPKDAFVVYNSGHGTNDGKRQGLVLASGVVWWEYEIRKLAAQLTPAIFISDSCFALGLARASRLTARTYQPRYVPLAQLGRRRQPAPTGRLTPRQYDYFAACDTGETADSTGDGGAFTNELLAVLRTAKPRLTMQGVYSRVRKSLPNAEHPQTPQFVASSKGFAQRTLGSFVGQTHAGT